MKIKELEELEATLAEFGIEGAGGGEPKPSTAVRVWRAALTLTAIATAIATHLLSVCRC